ncbi:unnamed protein product, partial [Gadus morhua 'NCC']
AARQYDKKNSHLDFSNTVKRWLRYTPERVGGVKRTTIYFTGGNKNLKRQKECFMVSLSK